MKRWIILLSVIVLAGVGKAADGVLASNELATTQLFALPNLELFKLSVTPTNFAFYGFHAPDEVAPATTNSPLLIYTIPLHKLQAYQPGDDFKTLWERTSRVIFPVVVPVGANTEVRSSLSFRIDATNNVVSDVKFGRRRLIRELMAAYETINPADVKADDAPFVVEIPVFDIWLIGYVNTQDRGVLVATINLPLGPVTIPATQFINEAAMFLMAVKAQTYNGAPN